MIYIPSLAGMSCQVTKLAAVRIRNLCDRLQQSQQVVEHVYRAFQHALNHETILFFNRHIDQVILCCLYGICKVSKLLPVFNVVISSANWRLIKGLASVHSELVHTLDKKCCVLLSLQVSKSNVTFRDIIYHYRKQPQCKPYVFRNVLLDVTRPGVRTCDLCILNSMIILRTWLYRVA